MYPLDQYAPLKSFAHLKLLENDNMCANYSRKYGMSSILLLHISIVQQGLGCSWCFVKSQMILKKFCPLGELWFSLTKLECKWYHLRFWYGRNSLCVTHCNSCVQWNIAHSWLSSCGNIFNKIYWMWHYRIKQLLSGNS